MIINSVSVHITPSLSLLWACHTPSSILHYSQCCHSPKSLCLGHHIKAHQWHFSFIRRDITAIATHNHLHVYQDRILQTAKWLQRLIPYVCVSGALVLEASPFFSFKPPSRHPNFFFFKTNHVLMYTHGASLSLFPKTTQCVYRSWVVSGLVVHIKSCVSSLERMKCRLTTANTVTHISRCCWLI